MFLGNILDMNIRKSLPTLNRTHSMSTGSAQRTRGRDLKTVVSEPWQRPAAAAAADQRGRDVHRPPGGRGSRCGDGPVLGVVEDLSVTVAVSRVVRLRLGLEHGHVRPYDLDALRLQEVELPVELVSLLLDVLQPALDLGLRTRHLLLFLFPLGLQGFFLRL